MRNDSSDAADNCMSLYRYGVYGVGCDESELCHVV